MSQTDQRQFNCEHCGGVITIPADLPPTSAPCPYCQKETTSPAYVSPVASSNEQSPVVRENVEEKVIPTRPATQKEPENAQDDEQPEKSGGGKLILILAILVLLALIGAVLIYLNGERLAPHSAEKKDKIKTEKTEKNSELDYLNEGWKDDATKVLSGFLAAKTVEEMAPFVIGGEEKIESMRAYYDDPKHREGSLKVEQFRHVPLIIADRERGIFMMDLQRPTQWEMKDFFRPLATREVMKDPTKASFNVQTAAFISNFTMDEERIFAFLKKNEAEMRLDWNVFVQSKDRLLKKFISYPESGKSEVFRGMIMEDVAQGVVGADANSRVYRISDLAHQEDTIRVAVPNNSEEGKFLAEIAWIGRGVQAEARNITLELKWGMEAEPVLKIQRILCWEFLGVGGELRDEAMTGE